MLRAGILLSGLAALAGCETPASKTAQVSSNFFNLQAGSGQVTQANYSSADSAVCMRVDSVGRKLLLENPQISVRPQFAAVLSESPEIFHLDQQMIIVSEGLVRKCRSDADLAALIALELGRMVAQREGRLPDDVRRAELRKPIAVEIGPGGNALGSDVVGKLELSNYEKDRAKIRQASGRPDSAHLARMYLEKAGWEKSDFEAAAPILQIAENHVALERQLKGTVTPGQWSPK